MSATAATSSPSDVLTESFADSVNIDESENVITSASSLRAPRISVTERVTAARINDKHHLELQQNTIPHSKDPWWEQRGGKGEEKIKASHKYDNVGSKLLSPTTAFKAGSREKASSEPSTPDAAGRIQCHGTKTKAIDPTSAVLRPTNATLKHSWAIAKDHEVKETEKSAGTACSTPDLTASKRTGPAVSSRLYEPTKAFKSSQYKPKQDEFDSSTPGSPRSGGSTGNGSTGNVSTGSPPSGGVRVKETSQRLLSPNIAMLAAQWNKTKVETDPRESAWDNRITRSTNVLSHYSVAFPVGSSSSNTGSIATAAAHDGTTTTTPTKRERSTGGVSHVHTPTAATVHAQWTPSNTTDVDTREVGWKSTPTKRIELIGQIAPPLPGHKAQVAVATRHRSQPRGKDSSSSSSPSPITEEGGMAVSSNLLTPTAAVEHAKRDKTKSHDPRESGWRPASGTKSPLQSAPPPLPGTHYQLKGEHKQIMSHPSPTDLPSPPPNAARRRLSRTSTNVTDSYSAKLLTAAAAAASAAAIAVDEVSSATSPVTPVCITTSVVATAVSGVLPPLPAEVAENLPLPPLPAEVAENLLLPPLPAEVAENV